MNKNNTQRRLQRCRLELSAGRTPSFIADCCNICQALENSLVLQPELGHLRTFIFCSLLLILPTILQCKFIIILFHFRNSSVITFTSNVIIITCRGTQLSQPRSVVIDNSVRTTGPLQVKLIFVLNINLNCSRITQIQWSFS